MCPYLHFFGRTIGSYGLLMAVAVFVAVLLACLSAKRNSIWPEDILIVSATALLFALCFGKLLYLFITFPIAFLWESILSGNFSFLFDGGIVFYGALFGGIGGALLGVRIAGTSFQKAEQTIVPFIPLGHGIGRIGCILAGCCYGRPYEGIFAIHYSNAVTGLSATQGYFPVQAVESFWNLLCCVCLLLLTKRCYKAGNTLACYLILYAVGRFFLEYLRGDALRGIWCGLSVSQWISLFLLCACFTFFLLRRLFTKHAYNTYG